MESVYITSTANKEYTYDHMKRYCEPDGMQGICTPDSRDNQGGNSKIPDGDCSFFRHMLTPVMMYGVLDRN